MRKSRSPARAALFPAAQQAAENRRQAAGLLREPSTLAAPAHNRSENAAKDIAPAAATLLSEDGAQNVHGSAATGSGCSCVGEAPAAFHFIHHGTENQGCDDRKDLGNHVRRDSQLLGHGCLCLRSLLAEESTQHILGI